VVPHDLKFADGTPARNDFNRVMGTAFNGASIVAQAGGLACLDEGCVKEIDVLIDHHMGNAKILRDTMESIGCVVHGGVDAPHVFVELPESLGGSWAAFSMILQCHPLHPFHSRT
jgi:LL-diaminopimelate aminotransferase